MGNKRVVILGATGAVGSRVAKSLADDSFVEQLTLLGRRPLEGIESPVLRQHTVDIFEPASYDGKLDDLHVAICTLGVGEPSKVSREQFVRIDKLAVLDFAIRCREAGIGHFQLLSSVGVNDQSRSFFLRTKGELEAGLRDLHFPRLSLFHPSMIITPTNRYGFTQALTLAVWPWLSHLMLGPLQPYRGIAVGQLARAFARNVHSTVEGEQVLTWHDFQQLASRV